MRSSQPAFSPHHKARRRQDLLGLSGGRALVVVLIVATAWFFFLGVRLWPSRSPDWESECFGCDHATAAAAAGALGPGARSLSLYVAVVSKCTNTGQREAIRKTWGRRAVSATVRFFVGSGAACDGGGGHGDEALADRDAGDVVRLDVEESYANLPSKVAAIFAHVSSLQPSPDILLKVDDDVYVDVPAFWARLALLPKEAHSALAQGAGGGAGVYAGYFHNRTRVSRMASDKWSDPLFPLDSYPPYAGGGAYWLTRPAFAYLGAAAKEGILNTGWRNEDASVGTWLAGTRFHRHHDEGYLRCIDCSVSDTRLPPWSVHLSRVADETDKRERFGKGSTDTGAAKAKEAGVLADMIAVHERVEKGGLIRGSCCDRGR
jgi:hypothetical protein